MTYQTKLLTWLSQAPNVENYIAHMTWWRHPYLRSAQRNRRLSQEALLRIDCSFLIVLLSFILPSFVLIICTDSTQV